MDFSLLYRLILAHILGDFVFQAKPWQKDISEKGIKSWYLFLNASLVSLFSYLFSGLFSNWEIPILVFIAHYIIDIISSYFPNKLIYRILDQIFHIACLKWIWILQIPDLEPIKKSFLDIYSNQNTWLLILAYFFITIPLGILIGKATEPWRKEIESSNDAKEGLENAGKWIGICERLLILTFILIHQFTAIGFLITAKSILRFGDKETGTQKKTEYVLVGTLMSFSITVLIGILVSLLLKGPLN